MPSRLVREGILTSSRVDELDAAGEVFYRRLMSKVDDHGLFDARLSILRSSLYPLRVDRVREADISRWIAACEKAGLIALYTYESKPYLQMLDTRWAKRGEPKFPLPPPNSIGEITAVNSCKQTKTDVSLFVFEGVVEDDISSECLTHPDPPNANALDGGALPKIQLSEFKIPLNDGSEHAVTAQTLQEWVKSFPAVDVGQELREMRAWSLANKAKRKTKRGVEAFVVRWLQKAQDAPSRRRDDNAGAGDERGFV